MKKFIVIVGASGSGKTTLAQALQHNGNFAAAFEQHAERPFQTLFKQDPRYALANQIDYLLYRAEQERSLREAKIPAVMDGGLDLDFHGFTKLFHHHGWLNDSEFDLCRRFYEHTRALLPAPDFVIHLQARAEVIRARLAARDRINLASAEDAALVETSIQDWLNTLPPKNVLHLDASDQDTTYSNLLATIQKNLVVAKSK